MNLRTQVRISDITSIIMTHNAVRYSSAVILSVAIKFELMAATDRAVDISLPHF